MPQCSRSDVYSGAGARDDLGQLIRECLSETVAEAVPPDDMWARIAGRMTTHEGKLERLRRKVHSNFPWVSLIQATVISSLLLGFVVGVDDQAYVIGRQEPPAIGDRAAGSATIGRRALVEESTAVSGIPEGSAEATPGKLGRGTVVDSQRARVRDAAWREVILAD